MKLFVRYRKFISLILIGSIALVSHRCANPVMPQGGPKDSTPPEIIEEKPVNGSVNFDEKSIEIRFNEYVKLSEPGKNILVSPPMKKQPEYKIRHKSVIIDFEDTLRQETTYKISFGKAIVDITEGNPAKEAEYVFSTGIVIDSMSLKGQIKNAFDLKPSEDIMVMLYPTDSVLRLSDSVPYKETPYYIARTDKSGNFNFSHLRNTPYILFALKDQNANFLFDIISEEIAFADSLIRPWYKPVKIDTTASALPDIPSVSHQLLLFKEVDTTQRIVKRENPTDGQLFFVFQRPVIQDNIKILEEHTGDFKMLKEWGRNYDTLKLWVNHPEVDTIAFTWSVLSTKTDTVQMTFKGNKQKNLKVKKALLDFNCGTDAQLNHFNPFRMFFNRPVTAWNTDSLKLFENSDTIYVKFRQADSLGKVFNIQHSLKPGATYELQADSASFTDFMGESNFARKIAFKTKAADAYGTLILNLKTSEISHPFIIQLLDEKEKVFKQFSFTGDYTFKSSPMLPTKFTVKAIFDTNNNGQWDTGKYLQNIQPEKVIFYNKTLEIRANWDLEEEWSIKP